MFGATLFAFVPFAEVPEQRDTGWYNKCVESSSWSDQSASSDSWSDQSASSDSWADQNVDNPNTNECS